jgi:hypothetical protein
VAGIFSVITELRTLTGIGEPAAVLRETKERLIAA